MKYEREDLPRLPAKLPKDYCKKQKGHHDFHRVSAEENTYLEGNRTHTSLHCWSMHEYRCAACQKKKVQYFLDGIFFAGDKNI